MLLFKANYEYALRTSLLPKQVKKSSNIAKERAEKLIILHKELCESAKMVQERMKMYYNKKRSEGPDLKKEDKMWLLYKNFKNWWLSKKLNYIKLGLFMVKKKNLKPHIQVGPTSKNKDLLSTAYCNIRTSIWKC